MTSLDDLRPEERPDVEWPQVALELLVVAVRDGSEDALTELHRRAETGGMPGVSTRLTEMYGQPQTREDLMTLIEELAERYSSHQPRDKHGRWTSGGSHGGGSTGTTGGGGASDTEVELPSGGHAQIITKASLSNPDTPRTRAVSRDEFTQLADEGKTRLEGFRKAGSAPVGLDRNWGSVKDEAWTSVQSEWGGATIDAHTGKALRGNEDKYALTVKPKGVQSVSVPIGARRAEFDTAMQEARSRFDGELHAQQHHLGVFRDEDMGRIDIDPVLVVNNLHDVETIGSYTHAVGGAYHFGSGDGYWPPYVG